MDLTKNYPWIKSLKVSEEDFRKWKSNDAGKSLVFWSLNNRVITQKPYFDWAIEYYQIPFLEDMYFEQYLMTKKQWDKIKDLSKWTPEIMPVAVWEDIIFIGCVQLPPKEEQTFPFKHRFVLTSIMALQTTWKFVQELSRAIKKDKEITQGQQSIQTSPKFREISDFTTKTPLEESITRTAVDSLTEAKANFLTEKDKVTPKQVSAPGDSLEKKQPSEDSLIQASTQLSDKEESQATMETLGSEVKINSEVLKTKNSEVKINSEVLKAQMSLPEEEQDRAVDPEYSTYPGRYPHKENDNLIVGNFKPKASIVKETVSSEQNEASSAQNIDSNQQEDKEFSETDITVSSTGTSQFTLNQNPYYEQLWKQTQTVFCTSMVLQVKGKKIYHDIWSGRMKVKDLNKELVDLKDHSLFKVVQKGHPYHGFIVEIPGNKKFFSNIGWDSYPKHITAIPIKNENQELTQIFVGLRTSPLSRDKIKDIEKIISDFFRSYGLKLPQAA